MERFWRYIIGEISARQQLSKCHSGKGRPIDGIIVGGDLAIFETLRLDRHEVLRYKAMNIFHYFTAVCCRAPV